MAKNVAKTATAKIAPKNVAPKNVAPKNVAPKNVAPKNVAPKNVAPKNVAAKDEANTVARDVAAEPIDDGLKLIQSKPEGILQSELWKELGVDSRKCSRIVKKLEESGLIERVEFKKDGIKTYLLRAKQQPVNPNDLLAGDELIPCVGCELDVCCRGVPSAHGLDVPARHRPAYGRVILPLFFLKKP